MPKTKTPLETNTPRQPVQARAIQTREKILDAGESLFLRTGFHKVLADDIARDAGVSVGSFYNYFKDKRAVFLAILERCSDQVIAGVVEQLSALPVEGDLDVVTIANQILESLMVTHRRYFPLFQQADQMAAFDEEIRAYGIASERSTLKAFEELLTRFLSDQAQADVAEIAFVLYHATEGIVHHLVNSDPTDLSMEKIKAEYSKFMVSYLRNVVK
jgi:AcrR family transcriptional regulator